MHLQHSPEYHSILKIMLAYYIKLYHHPVIHVTSKDNNTNVHKNSKKSLLYDFVSWSLQLLLEIPTFLLIKPYGCIG